MTFKICFCVIIIMIFHFFHNISILSLKKVRRVGWNSTDYIIKIMFFFSFVKRRKAKIRHNTRLRWNGQKWKFLTFSLKTASGDFLFFHFIILSKLFLIIEWNFKIYRSSTQLSNILCFFYFSLVISVEHHHLAYFLKFAPYL